MNGINMFENRHASQKFYKVSEIMTLKARSAFSNSVKALFDEKVTSEDGKHKSFKITIPDILMLESKVCWCCGRENCVCDEEYEDYKANH